MQGNILISNVIAKVLRDLIKRDNIVMLTVQLMVFVAVVLDRQKDKGCDTGRFELIYKQGMISDPPSVDHTLAVVGKKVKGGRSKPSQAT